MDSLRLSQLASGLRTLSRFGLMSALLLAVGSAFADTPEQNLIRANRLQRSGNIVEAAKLYEQFLKVNPLHTQVLEAHFRLAKCYDAQGRIEESIEQLTAVFQSKDNKFRNRGEAVYLLGKQSAALGEHKRALAIFEKLLSEGAGLREDEVLNLAGGYYAVVGKYEEAAAKFNILKRKKNSLLAEDAFFKLCMLWLQTSELERSVEAVQNLARGYPTNKQLPSLLFQLAQLHVEKKKYDQAIALSEQLEVSFPNSHEALAGRYLNAMCFRSRRDYKKAVAVLDALAKDPKAKQQNLALESAYLAAEILEHSINDKNGAIERLQQAAVLGRGTGDARGKEILEHCHFRLGEHFFAQKNHAVALENYVALRRMGSKLNVLGRILACQAALDKSVGVTDFNNADIEAIKKKIEANPGTAAAAEAEVFLLDRQLAAFLRRRGVVGTDLAKQYSALIEKYPGEVLSPNHLGAYIHSQVGNALFNSESQPEQIQAIAAYESALKLLPADERAVRIPTLENLALMSERAGESGKAVQAYDELYAITSVRLEAKSNDSALQKQAVGYLRSLVTRSDSTSLIDRSIELCRQSMEKVAEQPVLARESRFYLAELLYMKRDFSGAAKAFQAFVKAYGPKQTEDGEVENAPWKPKKVDENVQQVFDAAIGVAHAWFVQGHHGNMIDAYKWVNRNLPHGNHHMAEARYWLAIEASQTAGESKSAMIEAKARAAELLWTTVVNTSLDFRGPEFPKSFHPWVNAAPARKYVKTATLKAGDFYSKAGQHELAARIFEYYMKQFPRIAPTPRGQKPPTPAKPDPMFDMAHYAAGRQYVALEEIGKMVSHFEAYVDGMRDSRFRISALELMGFFAMKDGRNKPAVSAYATLIDEYGPNLLDDAGKPIALPVEKRLRQERLRWNGIRQPIAKGLEPGQIHYALGYLYWQQGHWERCAQVLQPFLDDPSLKSGKHGAQSLYMKARSHWKLFDYAKGVVALEAVIASHPKFAAIEEVCAYACEGYFEAKNWTAIDVLHQRFVDEWPASTRRPRMDFYWSVSQIAQDRRTAGLPILKNLANGETYEDVKADACHQLALQAVAADPPLNDLARDYFEKSIATFVRPIACRDAGRFYAKLGRWDEAKRVLSKAADFSDSNPEVIADVKEILADVEKQSSNAP